MVAPASSSLFMSFGNLWRLLALRSDVDDIIRELLGHFSLEKIYAESDKEAYQHLVGQLLAQLNAIFHIQRLTLPSENLQMGWYLGFLASWEVTLRSVEFVLQIVLEGRDSLWEAQSLRDKYLAEVLLSALRFLTLHPKAPSNQKAKDRRERFARIHRSLERIYDSYPGPKSFLLLVCKEITDALRSEPSALQLPPRLKYELPNLASEMYPLTECLTSHYVSTMVPQDGFSNEWLSQFLALRDVSLFVVGASIQYHVNRETREVKLQSASARTRNAVLHALENLRMPSHLSKIDLISTFSETFRIILPATPTLIRRNSTESLRDENEMDAVDALCVRLLDRQIVHRVSDNEMMHGVSEITRKIAQLDDPSGQYRATRPRLYVLDCGSCHLAGDSQLRYSENIKFPDSGDGSEIPLPPKTSCPTCGEPVSMMREITLARQTWELLKPLDSNADTINVERHLPTQFTLGPPKAESERERFFTRDYGNILAGSSSGQRSQDVDAISPQQQGRSTFQPSISEDRSRSIDASLLTPGPSSPGFNKRVETPKTEFSSDNFTSSDSATHAEGHKSSDAQSVSIGVMETPFSPDSIGIRPAQSQPLSRSERERSGSTSIFFDPVLRRSLTTPLTTPKLSQSPEKAQKSKWMSKLGGRSKREPSKASVDNSSISSGTLESQRLEEIPLKSLTNLTKSSRGGKSGKSINVYLSQNSTHALFWTQPLIHILDIGPSPPNLIRAIPTESTCVLAAVTKIYLAYIIGTRDQKLTLRIVNLVQSSASIVEYRMSTSPWCKSIAISPKENYVVVGFENSIVRFFKTKNTEAPREDRLHTHVHNECKECPPVDTVSFSNDGLVLLAGTRSPKSGTIQIYAWRFPFLSFQELSTCRYRVPLHESEDNGISSSIFRSGGEGPGAEQNLICITTWTQSGVPMLIQPEDNHRSEIRTDNSAHQGRLGSRIQCAAFSPSGRELAMVNEKGHLYQTNSLNSSPMDIRRIATSRELTAKSESFAMTYMTLPDEDAIILAWADSSKSVAYVKKIPMKFDGEVPQTPSLMHSIIAGSSAHVSRAELDGEANQIRPPVELNSPMGPRAETSNMIDNLMEEVKGHKLMKRDYR